MGSMRIRSPMARCRPCPCAAIPPHLFLLAQRALIGAALAGTGAPPLQVRDDGGVRLPARAGSVRRALLRGLLVEHGNTPRHK